MGLPLPLKPKDMNNLKEALDEADTITARDRELFFKAHNGNFPARTPGDWARLRNKADSQIMRDYFHEEYKKAEIPFATLTKLFPNK